METFDYKEIQKMIAKPIVNPLNNFDKDSFNKHLTLYTTKAIKYDIKQIARQNNVSCARLIRFVINNLNYSFPVKHYQKQIELDSLTKATKKTEVYIHFVVSQKMLDLLENDCKKVGCTKRKLLNILLKNFIVEYKKSRKKYLLDSES